jgi:hypothetical protein
MAPRPPCACPTRRARSAFRRKPPDLYPELLQRLQQEFAAKTAAARAVNAATAAVKTQPQIRTSRRSLSEGGQPVTAPSAENPDPQPISQHKSNAKKEKPAMPATVTTRAKAALRARKPARRRGSNSESASPHSLGEGGPSRHSLTDTEAESTLKRHSRKCKICNHPDREAIEEMFINWHSPQSIQGEFAFRRPFDWTAVYRHARAVGLYGKRSKNLRAVFDLILERAAQVNPTAHGIVAVVRAYSCLTDAHQWVEPERRVHIVNEVYRHDLPASPDVGSAETGPPPSAARPDEERAVANASPQTAGESESAQNQSSLLTSSAPVSSSGSLPPSTVAPSSAPAPALATNHSFTLRDEGPLFSNRQPSELKSPPTNT